MESRTLAINRSLSYIGAVLEELIFNMIIICKACYKIKWIKKLVF